MKTTFSQLNRIAIMALVVLFTSAGVVAAQVDLMLNQKPENTITRSGNKLYADENFTDAEASYKKALDLKNNMPEATFNLGDALYKQKRYDDAGKQFQLSAQNNQDAAVKANAYYNLGNSHLEQKKWEDAIKAYKEALKINPKDADAKYNLAYANAMLKKGQGGGKGKDDKNKDKKDKKDDKQEDNKDNKDGNKDKQQNQEQKDKQGKDDKQNQQQEDKDKKQQGQKSKLSREESEQLLQALMNEEQKTTQKMQQKQMKGSKIKIQKDW